VVDATGALVLPGFVDTHRHMWQTVFRSIAADCSLLGYAAALHRTLKPHFRPEDMYIGNLLGRVEALSSGVTTLLDWSHGISSPAAADAALQGLIDGPGRSVFAYSGYFGPPSEEPIDSEMTRLRNGPLASDDGLVTLALGLRGPQYSSVERTELDVKLARELDLRVSVHGGSAIGGADQPVAKMHERGLLDELTTVVHCNFLSDAELAMIADAGATASVAPVAEMQMGYGWPATGRLLDAGVRPSLSIDDCAAVGGEMFSTMRIALLVQRALDNQQVSEPYSLPQLRLSSRDMLEFGTVEGARACGLADRVGTITPGKAADLVVLRADDPAIFPLNNPPGAVLSAGHPGLVDTVLVAGRIVKRDGKLVGVDLERLRELALDSRESIVRRAVAAGTPPITTDGRWNPIPSGVGLDQFGPN
jgi:cytosine/adenosine deaminase-related metal-dependent hydrolase